jgi:hypothetical protein
MNSFYCPLFTSLPNFLSGLEKLNLGVPAGGAPCDPVMFVYKAKRGSPGKGAHHSTAQLAV